MAAMYEGRGIKSVSMCDEMGTQWVDWGSTIFYALATLPGMVHSVFCADFFMGQVWPVNLRTVATSVNGSVVIGVAGKTCIVQWLGRWSVSETSITDRLRYSAYCS